jgi:hypothetical protein
LLGFRCSFLEREIRFNKADKRKKILLIYSLLCEFKKREEKLNSLLSQEKPRAKKRPRFNRGRKLAVIKYVF